uniref:Uncharacterized protein n=1 Tax=Strongyloides papillosus TaxID=174720 RepID=A0A0N5BGX1_STREA
MSNLNDSLDESSKFKLIQLRELLKKIDDALPLNDQQLLRYSGVLDRREKQQLPILRGLLKGDSLLNSTNSLQSTVSSVDKLTLSPIKLSLSPPKLTSTPIKDDQIYQTKHHHNSTKSNQSSAAISNKPKTMSYHFTLAVTKFSHTETSRKFSTFLSQIRDAFAIDGVTDENTKFPLLRSRFEDKAREMLPNKLPDETFDQYLTRLAPIFDDTLITNDLETQYSFFKLNFSNDKFEKTLREFVQLHETMYRDLPAELNFQSFRRRLLDLLTPKPY